MRSARDLIGAIDFGSREIRVAIAQRDATGAAQVIGYGAAQSQGCVSQGVIQDLAATQSALRNALAAAESEARVHVPTFFCGINGKNVETFVRDGHVKVDHDVIDQSHMDEALDIASRDVLEAGKRVISSLAAQEWYVDDLRVIDPRGISGHVLKTRVHFARLPAVIEENIIQCVESQRRELEDIMFMPLAASLGCLTPEDRELGIAVLDLGRSTTGLAVFRDRRILATHCFPWGGYHLTRDVAAGLHVSFEEADELVMEYGISDQLAAREQNPSEQAAVGQNPGSRFRFAQIKLKTAVPGAPSIVARDQLEVIVHDRAEEMMSTVRQFVQSRGLSRNLIRGLVLAGGAAEIRNYTRLAERVFETPCRVGHPGGLDFVSGGAASPSACGLVGILRYGLEYRAAQSSGRIRDRGLGPYQIRRLWAGLKRYFI